MALTGSTIASTYLKLLRVNTDTMGADATASYIQDSADTDSALSISTTRVGIGTATPAELLTIQESASAPATISFCDTDGGELGMIGASRATNNLITGSVNQDLCIVQTKASKNILFATNDTEVMRIDSSGNVGIGTTAPASYYSSADDLVVYTSGATGISIVSGTSSEGTIAFADGTSGDTRYRGWIQYAHGSDDMSFATDGGLVRLKLDGDSRISLSNNDDGDGNTVFGYLAGNALGADTDNCVFIGENAGLLLAGHNAGAGSVGIGKDCFDAADGTEMGNVAIGHLCMGSVDEGASGDADFNVALGYNALRGGAFSGADALIGNIAIGSYAMDATDTNAQTGTVAIGHYALSDLTSGAGNIAIGYQAMLTHTTGSRNLAIGHQAMMDTDHHADVLGSTDNIFIGYQSGAGTWETNDSNYNVAVGNYTMDANGVDGASQNTAVGHTALGALTTGGNNTAVGSAALTSCTVGYENVAVGQASLYDNNSNYNTAVGRLSGRFCTGEQNTYVGFSAGKGAAGAEANNVGVGSSALAAVTSATGNVCVGQSAGVAITTSTDNVILGRSAFAAADAGQNDNIVIGANAGLSMNASACDSNVIIGSAAATGGIAAIKHCIVIGTSAMNSTGTDAQTGTIAIGHEALTALTTGAGNTAIGYQAGLLTTTGASNVYLGYAVADATHVDSTGNVAIGKNTFGGSHTGSSSNYNTAVGEGAMSTGAMNGALNNTAVGYGSLSALIEGDGNTVVGQGAGDVMEDGINNVCMGKDAGNTIVDGSNNTLIGKDSDTSAVGSTNQTVIGYTATGQADNSVTLGNDDVTDVYMAEDSGASVHADYVHSQNVPNHVANTMPAPYYRFDGTDDYIGLGHPNDLEWRQGDFSISFLIRPDELSYVAGTHTSYSSDDWYITLNYSNNIRFTASWDTGTIAIRLQTDDNPVQNREDELMHIVIVVDRDDSSKCAIYVDGVSRSLGTSTIDDGAYDIDYGSLGTPLHYTLGRVGGNYPQIQLHSWSQFNKALTAAEVKELYSGASVPFKYKGANQTNLIIGGALDDQNGTFETGGSDGDDVSTGTDWVKSNTAAELDNEAGSGVNTYNGSTFCAKIHTATGNYPSIALSGANFESQLTIGKRYRVSFDYKVGGTQGSAGSYARLTTGSVTTNLTLASTSWTSVSMESDPIPATASAELRFYSEVGTSEDGDEILWIDNVSVIQIGAVAEYDGSGITNDKWFDKSGNELHGTVTGATDENTAAAPVISENHPAFLVHPTSSQDDIATDSSVDIVFGTEIFDQGSNFSSTTFTAPVTGKYLFTWGIRLGALDTAANYYNISLVTSNRSHDQIPILDPGGFSGDLNYITLSGSILTDMDISDTAKLVIEQSAGTAQTDITAESRFSGYLVC